MTKWADFDYRDFYDVPRAILARLDGAYFYLNCPFDPALDEYPDSYAVYRMPDLSTEELAGSWVGLESRALEFLGTVTVGSIALDPTLRRQIDLGFVDRLPL